MNISALIEELRQRGVDAEVILAAVEAVSRPVEEKPRSKGAERQARYRARKAESVTSDVTRDVTRDVTGEALPPLPPSPPDPPYNPPSPPSGSDTSLRSVSGRERPKTTALAVVVDNSEEPLDPRDVLWNEGLETLAALTMMRDLFSGEPSSKCRSLMGRFVKQADSDHAAVHAAIMLARDMRVIHPESWITQHLAKRKERTHDGPVIHPVEYRPVNRSHGAAVLAQIQLELDRRKAAGIAERDPPDDHPAIAFRL